jgi:MazG family protein
MESMRRLLEIMARLRDPETGCSWDLKQDFASIAPYTVEEAYEVDDAIRQGDMEALRDELGDLLLQVVYHAQMAREAGHFDFEQVAGTVAGKLVRRHPHVFGDAVRGSDADLHRAWEDEKARERAEKAMARTASAGGTDCPGGDPFEGVALSLPALARAAKLQKRAARLAPDEATAEPSGAAGAAVRKAFEGLGDGPSQESLGELLFAVVQLARTHGLDPEHALREANAAFEKSTRSELQARS